MTPKHDNEWSLIQTSVAYLRASIMAVVFGMLGGIGLFVATVWLLIRGGADVGVTLSLLNNYYPGYSVTWIGAFVGLFYGALTGAILGYSVALSYNLIAMRRDRKNRQDQT